MLYAHRITKQEDAQYALFKALYESSFPREEKRPEALHLAALKEADYYCLCLHDEQGLAGILTYWEQGSFIFVEHLAIATQRRGQGLGHELMDYLAHLNKPLILEIEPPVDDLTRARERFYKSCGYIAIPHAHIQLPFNKGDQPLPMQLMCYPHAFDDALVRISQSYIAQHAMQYREL